MVRLRTNGNIIRFVSAKCLLFVLNEFLNLLVVNVYTSIATWSDFFGVWGVVILRTFSGRTIGRVSSWVFGLCLAMIVLVHGLCNELSGYACGYLDLSILWSSTTSKAELQIR